MISSQDGTEDRLPRAAFRPWRAVCSPAGSGWAAGTGSTGGADGAADTADVAAAGATVAEFPPADGGGVCWRALDSCATRESWATGESWADRACRAAGAMRAGGAILPDG